MLWLAGAFPQDHTAFAGITGRQTGVVPGGLSAPSGSGGRCAMTTYIMLIHWTEQGIKNVRESPRRLDAAKKQLADMGGSFKDFYMTMGDADMVAVCDAPDDAVAARFALQLGMAGNVRTRTLKAFPEAAYREIITS